MALRSTPHLSSSARDDLRALAEAATPGPWAQQREFRTLVYGNPAIGEFVCDTGKEGLGDADAEFIAAANPQTVLALLAELDRVEEELRTVRGKLAHVRERNQAAWDEIHARGAQLADARRTLDGVRELTDHIEDEQANRCCNRGPRQPCTEECSYVARILDRFRAAASSPVTDTRNEPLCEHGETEMHELADDPEPCLGPEYAPEPSGPDAP